MRDFVTYYLLKGLSGIQNQGVNALDNYETKKILLQLWWSSGSLQYFILKKIYSDFVAAYTCYSLLHLPEAWIYYPIVHSITFYQFIICFDFEYGFYDKGQYYKIIEHIVIWLTQWLIFHNSEYMIRYTIWYHLYNLKNVKNTHEGVLLLVKLQAKACNFSKINTRPWVFFMFFKLGKW